MHILNFNDRLSQVLVAAAVVAVAMITLLVAVEMITLLVVVIHSHLTIQLTTLLSSNFVRVLFSRI